MKRIPVPNSNPAHEFGVELDKKLKDGKNAIGVVDITETPSPFKPDEILLRVNAWQVRPDGRAISQNDQAGRDKKRGIREMVVAVPRSEFTSEVAGQQVEIAAKALELVVADLPDETPAPAAPAVRPAPAPAPKKAPVP